MTLLSIRNIVVERAGALRLSYPDIDVRKHDMIALVGPSGCGKTSLLSVIAGLLPPSSGTVEFAGENLTTLTQHARDRIRGQRMGFVFQTLHLLPSLTLRQNIALAASMSGKKLNAERLEKLMDQLGLAHRANGKPEALSQGEQQRAAIARAVLNEPDIIIADEPTSSLDHENAGKVIELLKWQAKESGSALLVATHDERIIGEFPNVISLHSQTQSRAA